MISDQKQFPPGSVSAGFLFHFRLLLSDECRELLNFAETDGNNSYNYLEPIAKADEIWDRMEESLNVDDKPTDSD